MLDSVVRLALHPIDERRGRIGFGERPMRFDKCLIGLAGDPGQCTLECKHVGTRRIDSSNPAV